MIQDSSTAQELQKLVNDNITTQNVISFIRFIDTQAYTDVILEYLASVPNERFKYILQDDEARTKIYQIGKQKIIPKLLQPKKLITLGIYFQDWRSDIIKAIIDRDGNSAIVKNLFLLWPSFDIDDAIESVITYSNEENQIRALISIAIDWPLNEDQLFKIAKKLIELYVGHKIINRLLQRNSGFDKVEEIVDLIIDSVKQNRNVAKLIIVSYLQNITTKNIDGQKQLRFIMRLITKHKHILKEVINENLIPRELYNEIKNIEFLI